MPQQTIYSASQPIGGAATRAKFPNSEQARGLVPYFVSGPLSRKGMLLGFIGTILHVVSWLLALVFDIVAMSMIHPDHSPGAFAFWLWGLITLLVALALLVGVTIWHMVSDNSNKIPEGGAPPFLLTLLIGGAQISLLLTLVNLIQSGAWYGWAPYTSTDANGTAIALGTDDHKTKTGEWRTMLIMSMIFKVYVVQFLRNNQEWAGPAEAYKAEGF